MGVIDKTKDAINSIGAMQTLVENFPMHLISLDNLQFSASFDVLAIIFKICGITKEEVIETVTNLFCGSMKDRDDGSGILSWAEEIVKMALEANIINILNCTTNPIISNNLLDSYSKLGIEYSGEGIVLDVAEIDFTGILNRSPFVGNGDKFYFDIEDYNANTLYKSKDFNAYLWYIINRSDVTQTTERTWDNRYRAQIYGPSKNKQPKEIIKCTYIDDEYPNTDKIRVQLCGSNYYKTRKVKVGKWEQLYNKTIFEFNHEFLSSIKLYEPKVVIAEIIEYLFGSLGTVNLGFSLNDEIIKGKIDGIIESVINESDLGVTEIKDCSFSFSNEQYNKMLEKSELNRHNIVRNGDSYSEVNPDDYLNQLSAITSTSTLNDDKTVINNTLNQIFATAAQDAEVKMNIGTFDWQFEIMRALVYPFVRPLFTPKVIFLLMVNQKIMGSLEDLGKDIETGNFDTIEFVNQLLNSLLVIIKDIIVQLKDMLIEMFMELILSKLRPLLELFASKLLLETLKMYRDLLQQIIDTCLFGFKLNPLVNGIDNVNYADIIPSQTEPEQSTC
jgi:hypothetical protein